MGILAVDIGNTNIVLGVFDGDRLIKHWRLSSRRRATVDEYGIILLDLFRVAGFDMDDIGGAAVCCVVPSLEHVFKDTLRDYAGVKPLVVGPGIKTGIPILTDNPREVGADRIVNAVAAFDRVKRAVIVVDFGTAVTFDYVTPDGEYAGGVIAPGISISTDALFERAAKLPRVEISRPMAVIGKSTRESMRAGIYYGSVSMVDGIVDRIKKEAGTDPAVIATGGMAPLIATDCRAIDDVDEFLTLKGLKTIYGVNNR